MRSIHTDEAGPEATRFQPVAECIVNHVAVPSHETLAALKVGPDSLMIRASVGPAAEEVGMRTRCRFARGVLAAVALLGVSSNGSAQMTGVENGEWRYLGGDAGHTRSSPLNQVNASNFANLKVAWIFRGDNFGPGVEYTAQSTPVFVDGLLYTVIGQRRQVVAIDAATGGRGGRSVSPTRRRYLVATDHFGKGVAYPKIDGRGVIFISTPAFFLWALDAKTGRPLENWGTAPVP